MAPLRYSAVGSMAVLAAILLGAYVAWHAFGANRATETTVGARTTQGAVSAPIPATVATVQKADFPVYLEGLGTVQPFQTVTVRSRVDGQIVKVEFKQGRMVQEGDVLVEIDPRPYKAAVDQAAAKKAQDEANLANAKRDLDRYTSLKDFASRQQVDTQQALVDQLTAQVAGDQAALENAQTQLDYTTIKAPLAGRTGFRTVDPGNIVHAADQNGIVTIVQLQPISVVFTAPEEEIPRINKALEAGEVPVKALSSDGLRTLAEGRLALVNNQVDQATGTIGMKGVFANKDDVLWPGLSVATRVLVETLKQVVVVPDDAVQRGPNGLYVFVVDADNKVAMQPVTVSHTDEGRSVVERGLESGQTIVVAGQYRLQAGSLVRPATASPSKAVATEAQDTFKDTSKDTSKAPQP